MSMKDKRRKKILFSSISSETNKLSQKKIYVSLFSLNFKRKQNFYTFYDILFYIILLIISLLNNMKQSFCCFTYDAQHIDMFFNEIYWGSSFLIEQFIIFTNTKRILLKTYTHTLSLSFFNIIKEKTRVYDEGEKKEMYTAWCMFNIFQTL